VSVDGEHEFWKRGCGALHGKPTWVEYLRDKFCLFPSGENRLLHGASWGPPNAQRPTSNPMMRRSARGKSTSSSSPSRSRRRTPSPYSPNSATRGPCPPRGKSFLAYRAGAPLVGRVAGDPECAAASMESASGRANRRCAAGILFERTGAARVSEEHSAVQPIAK
jgi:hypothetical protein